LKEDAQHAIDEAQKERPIYIERVPRENVPNISNDEGINSEKEVYEFEDQVVASDEKPENPKCSNNDENKSETKEISRSEECYNLCQQDTNSKENIETESSHHTSNGTSIDVKESDNESEKDFETKLKDVKECHTITGGEFLDDNLTSQENNIPEANTEIIESNAQENETIDDDQELSTNDSLMVPDKNADSTKIVYDINFNDEGDPIIVSGSVTVNEELTIEEPVIVSGSVTIDEELPPEHNEKDIEDPVNADSPELTTNTNEEEIEESYSLLSDIKATNDSIDESIPPLRPMTNLHNDEDKSSNSIIQEDYAVIDKNDMIEEDSNADDESSSSNSDKTPSMTSSTHVSTFGVWDVQPVLNTEVEEEVVSSEKEENTNVEQKRSKKRRSKQK